MSDNRTHDSDTQSRDWSVHPAFIAPPYKSTVLRGPTQMPIHIPSGLGEQTGPVIAAQALGALDNDLTKNAKDLNVQK